MGLGCGILGLLGFRVVGLGCGILGFRAWLVISELYQRSNCHGIVGTGSVFIDGGLGLKLGATGA